MIRTKLLALCLMVVTMAMTITLEAQTQPLTLAPEDEAQIRAALKTMSDAWNNHDMKAFVSVMADDVEWVNIVGMWWRGKAQVYQAHEAFHQTIFKNRQIHPPEKVELQPAGPDTVIVTSITPTDGFTTPSGHIEPPSRNILTEVFVRRNGRWLIVRGHNTTIVEEAQRSNPVK